MEQFISVIIFSLPGVLTYFWLQLFGINPAVKHTPTEMLGLAALLCVPTAGLTIVIYDIGYFLFDTLFKTLKVDLSTLKLQFLFDMKDLNALSLNLLFLFYYVVLSVCFSFLVAWLWSTSLYSKVMKLVNKVRIKRKMAKLSEDTSVWDKFFLKMEKSEESPLIVEMYKIDKPEEKFYGAVVGMSRPFETERSLIIEPGGWKESHEYYKYSIKRTYVDTKSGIIINELDFSKSTMTEEIITSL